MTLPANHAKNTNGDLGRSEPEGFGHKKAPYFAKPTKGRQETGGG